MTITAAQRFARSHPCPCCGGYDQAPRRHGVRCAGFISDDGQWCHCSREEHAGGLTMNTKTYPPTYAHRLTKKCMCGATHDGTVSPVSVEGLESIGSHQSSQRKRERGTWACCYVYTDERGVGRHRTVRLRDPKGFFQQHNVDGEWQPRLDGIETVLYGLPRLIRTDPEAPIYLTEGEKDCESLWFAGLNATTYTNGVWKAHYNQWIAGRHVVIVEDNDDAGRMRTRRLKRQLNGVAASVRIKSFPDLPVGGDVSDWLAAGGTASELLEPVATPYMEARQA